MVRRLSLAVGLVALAFLAPAAAQIPGYPNGCATCAVYGWIDSPAQGAIPTVSQSKVWVIGGWGFQCYNGQPADRVDVAYRGDDGYFHGAFGTWNLTFGERPDVTYAYGGLCPNMTNTLVGFSALYGYASRIPLGEREVSIGVWRGPYYELHTRRINVVP